MFDPSFRLREIDVVVPREFVEQQLIGFVSCHTTTERFAFGLTDDPLY